MSSKKNIRVLVVEDNPDDAYLLRRELLDAKSAHIDLALADRLSDALECLAAEPFDVVVSDLGLPDSQGFETFLRLHNQHPDIPVIVLTGHSDENLAITAVQSGAQDYLVKGEVDGDLIVRSIRHSIERQKLIAQLEKSLAEIKTLKGLIPVCAWCRKIRDDRGYWKMVETYIEEQTEASFTHGICPECLKKSNPELFEEMRREKPEIGRGAEESARCDQPAAHERVRVLLIEHDAGTVDFIRGIFSDVKEVAADLTHSPSLSSGIEHLARGRFDVVISDLGLPDGPGIETFIRIQALYPHTPIIVLADPGGEAVALKAVKSGAQDYLVKGRIDREALIKSIRYSVERRKLFMELENNMTEIKKLESERRHILSMFAYDIKNAIVPPSAFSTGTRSELEATQHRLGMAEHLLANFIQYSTFEIKGCKPRPDRFDIKAVLREQIDGWRIQADRKNIKIACEFSKGRFPILKADGAMINRVLTILIDNALKYTDPGGAINIRGVNIKNKILVQVKDSGIGIPEVHIRHIFEPFYRAAGDRIGSGLGLCVAKTIIEAHSGEIWVESAPGEGSTFSFTLPLEV